MLRQLQQFYSLENFKLWPETERPGRDPADESVPGLQLGMTRPTLSPAVILQTIIIAQMLSSEGEGPQDVNQIKLQTLNAAVDFDFESYN